MLKRFCVPLVLLLLFSTSAWARMSAIVGGGLGATLPQGEFNTYTETGFSLMGFGVLNFSRAPFLGIRAGVQGVFFERDERDVVLAGYPFTEVYTNNLVKGTLGFELTRRLASLEPYAGAGFGVYYFESRTSLQNPDGLEISSKKLKSETKFGWNLNGGLRIYIVPKVAIDLNVQYDIVQDMEQYRAQEDDPNQLNRVSLNSEFLSLFAGVSIPLGFF